VDPWSIVAIALAVALVVVAVVAARRRQTIQRIRSAAGLADDPVANVDDGLIRALADRRDQLTTATAEVQRTREASDRLIEVVGPGVLIVDADGRVARANEAAGAMLGRTAASLRARTVMEVFLDRSVDDQVRTAIATGSATTEIHPAGPDGPTLQVRARRRPDGGVWLLVDDLSEVRRLQRIRREFIDNLSHELRTPLTTVSLLAEMLAMDAEAAGSAVPDRMRERISKVEVETGHLVQMVNELLDLSRIEGGTTLELVDGVDVGPLAAGAAERLRTFAERQGVELQLAIAPELPLVRADPARLGQVVVNLVHNAVKFSPDGGVVTVRVEAPGGGVRIAVEDHGVGIPKAAQDRIFERFYKVDRVRRRADVGGGTGLGLAIARHVIQQHGGRLWLESEEGRGSTFFVELPVSVPIAT
jgi:two-component system phosphate regulon sensor histidine kinase PhoR